ncbi:MAG: glycosyltransferase [Clostridiales bacterium]|nr:glycosyltransferase [Clostridiales bacterium]
MSFLEILRTIIMVINVITMAILLYQVGLAFFCMKKRPERRPVMEKNHRFGVIISARNEETVIGHLVKSLVQQDYPRDCFDVIVIADNCTDETAKAARDAGAVVYERFDEVHKGKGYALAWIFDILFHKEKKEYDAFCIFDADNLVDKGYLASMNQQLCCGVDAAQGYRGIKNPGDSWVSGSYAIYFWTVTRFFMCARDNAGFSCFASGTGFMFRSDLVREDGWSTNTITEDTEFSVQQILKGRRVVFNENAIFYDEQPTKFGQSIRQRYRWSVGNVQCLVRYLPIIWKEGRKKLRFSAFMDLMIYLIAMPITGLVVINTVLTVVLTCLIESNPFLVLLYTLLPIVGCWVVMFFEGVLAVRAEKKRFSSVLKGLFGWPIFLYSWMYINLTAFFYRDTTWKPIAHTKSVGIDEVDGGDQRQAG